MNKRILSFLIAGLSMAFTGSYLADNTSQHWTAFTCYMIAIVVLVLVAGGLNEGNKK